MGLKSPWNLLLVLLLQLALVFHSFSVSPWEGYESVVCDFQGEHQHYIQCHSSRFAGRNKSMDPVPEELKAGQDISRHHVKICQNHFAADKAPERLLEGSLASSSLLGAILPMYICVHHVSVYARAITLTYARIHTIPRHARPYPTPTLPVPYPYPTRTLPYPTYLFAHITCTYLHYITSDRSTLYSMS